jgi:hypothetical protein
MEMPRLEPDVERVANAIMMVFIKKWFLGSYRGGVWLDCVNGEMAWIEEAKAAIAAVKATGCASEASHNVQPPQDEPRDAVGSSTVQS